MTPKARALLSALAAAAILRPGAAGSAATSGGIPSPTSFAAPSGARVPVPPEYALAWTRTRDEAAAPESMRLSAAGTPQPARAEDAGLGAGDVVVEVLPLDGARDPEERAARFADDLRSDPGWSRVRRLPGLAYPALAAASDGRVRVCLVTRAHLVRITAARWTSAFDAVVRGFRDAA